MTKRDYLVLSFAATILGIIVAMTPKVETSAYEASFTPHGIDILGLSRNARNLPEENYPAY